MDQKNVGYVTIGFLKILDSNFKDTFVINVMIYGNDSLFLKRYSNINAKGDTFRCILMGISKNESLKRLNNSVTYDRGVL